MAAPEPQKETLYYDPLRPLGIFLTVFGASVLPAFFVKAELLDRFMNLSVGLVILALGLGFWIVGHRRAKAHHEKKASETKS
jgi:hypothetical protein